MKTKALLCLQGRPEEALVLKRLALLFDEIHYVQPQAYSLTQKALANPEIVKKTDDGRFIITEEFNFFRDVDLEWSRLLTSSEDARLTSILEPFVDAGIAVRLELSSLNDIAALNASFDEVRMALQGMGLGDEILQRLSNTKLSDFDITRRTTLVTFAPTPDDPNELKVPFIQAPNVIADTDSILQSAFLSDHFQLSPIFHVGQHRRELSYIYEKYKSAILSLNQSYPELKLMSDDKAKFGEIAFSLLDNTISSSALAKISADKILRLRAAMADSREKFISKELIELNELVQTNPWSGPAATEIRKFVNGRLRGATTEFERRSADIWSKMRVDLAVSTAEAGKRALLGGGVGTGILGLIAPGASMWRMVAVAALASVVNEGPKIVKIVGEAIREAQHNSCSSIAYVNALRRL